MPVNQTTTHRPETIDAVTRGFGISYAVTSVLSALLVVIKESSESIHDLLAVITGHHWVTHGLLDIIIFLSLGFILSKPRQGKPMTVNTLIMLVVSATAVSVLIIAGYFI
jgi:hypothetical protein